MIRSSALGQAEHCTMSAELAKAHPNTSPAAGKGRGQHDEVAGWISAGKKPTSVEVIALASVWSPPKGAETEVATTLSDPETGEVLTQGTADCAWVEDGVLFVVDWKTGQMEGVDEADSNLQIAAYGAALALSRGLDAYRAGLCFLRGDGPVWDWADVVRGSAMWAPIERIAAIVRKPVVATTGPHCARCYPRMHCSAFLLPAMDTDARDKALVPLSEKGLVAADRVAEVQLAASALADLAERAKDWVRAQISAHGGAVRVGGKELALVEQAGKRSVSVAAVEAAGRSDLVKTGPAFTSLRWRNVKPHERKAG